MLETVCGGADMCTGLIYDIRHNDPQDGLSALTTILFKGCSFSCWWCPNPALQSASIELLVNETRCVRCGLCVDACYMEAARKTDNQEKSAEQFTVERDECIVCGACIDGCAGEARRLVGKYMTVDEVLEQIGPALPSAPTASRVVVFSGGEPLIQVQFLEDLLKACKKLGFYTVVDTSGYTPWNIFERVRPWVDLFQVNLTFFDNARHREFTGLPNAQILENIQALSDVSQQLVVRVPVIPNINDDVDNMSAIATFSTQLPHLKGVQILPLHETPSYRYERLGKSYHQGSMAYIESETLDHLVDIYRSQCLNVSISPLITAD